MILTRRNILRGLVAMPALVIASSLMPLRGLSMLPEWCPDGWLPCDGRALGKNNYPEFWNEVKAVYGVPGGTWRIPVSREELIHVSRPTFYIPKMEERNAETMIHYIVKANPNSSFGPNAMLGDIRQIMDPYGPVDGFKIAYVAPIRERTLQSLGRSAYAS